MKTPILILAFACFLTGSYAQSFAVINDKDGYVNVRKDKNINSYVVGKLDINSIFGIWEQGDDKSDWVEIYSQLGDNKGIQGYIHKSRIKFLSSFNSIKNVHYQDNFCSAKNDSIKIRINSSKFIAKAHRVKYNKPTNNEGSYIESIDNKPIWGTDGELPKRGISLVSVIIKGKAIQIPKSAFNDLYEPRFSTLNVYLGINNTIYIELDNSDGAGYYTGIWVIKNGHYQKRYIDNSEA
ncbi:hypothetical protein IDJ75_04320 [Mucilaginibacter rigui]|uniref:SH3 domain-containing protein n=1 Tax=Mucilaginibacter rigui TaxID=534635 RepID=A0ABR7X1P9_9SPHI|nr:hypothetical protein [Mucilaginibacter rigui]MBD1384494.1 hypothetical protein [Mucilaginibacter rigui]